MKFSFYFIVSCVFFLSCEVEEEPSGFAAASGVANEGDGVKTVTIELGRSTTSAITINYLVGGTAFLNGDYRVLTPASISSSSFVVQVKAGESTAALSIELIDDGHIEPENETIFFLITGSSDTNLNRSLNNTQFVLEVEDNDIAPSEGLQIDLSWHTGDGVSINAANFDLYLARQVELNGSGQLLSFELVQDQQSTNGTGFESFVMREDITDEVYYVIIQFVEGSLGADVFLHLSQGNQYGTASGRVNTNYVGKNVYYGPISKNGNSFSFH